MSLDTQAHLDDYNTIRCINYIRSEVAAARDPRPHLAAAVGADPGASGNPPWDADTYMRPVLPEDPLLFHEYDEAEQM